MVAVSAFGYERQDVALADALVRGSDVNRLTLRLARAPGWKSKLEEN